VKTPIEEVDMDNRFTVRWQGDLAGRPEQVWDAITAGGVGWLWPIAYEPRVGGRSKDIEEGGGTVTVWEPARHFATKADEGFNELDYVLTPAPGGGTTLRYEHRGETTGDHDVELDACRQHTDLYYHSLVEYVGHFAGRDATYVSADAPASSSSAGSFAALKRALGLPDDVAVGDTVTLRPEGLPAVEGVVDYATPAFLGVRGTDALYRFYGRDHWGWPVGVAHHYFADPVPADAWQAWLNGLFSDEAVA
jgi:hypothetical protein